VPSKSISGKAETVSGTEAEATSGVRPRVGVSSCYVFKATSPSCGIGGIPRYAAGRRPADHRGRGVFAARVIARYPLQHAFSRVSRHLDPRRRADMAARIESYRRGTVPLSVPIAILAHYASDDELPWLAGQTTWNRFRPRSGCATTCRASAPLPGRELAINVQVALSAGDAADLNATAARICVHSRDRRLSSSA
jgi:hypothetical protein